MITFVLKNLKSFELVEISEENAIFFGFILTFSIYLVTVDSLNRNFEKRKQKKYLFLDGTHFVIFIIPVFV